MAVRPAAVAGLFYPGDARQLKDFICSALADAAPVVAQSNCDPEAVIVPHAGYIYSGLTAAFAYAALARKPIRRVVVLGPAHRVAFYGIALPASDAFATPLGEVAIDRALRDQLNELPAAQINDAAHALEHSLEVQLPFLQVVLNDFTLLPLCIGATDPDVVTAAIELLRGSADTLFVISSDLSHYHPYAEARRLDLATIDQIRSSHTISHEQACGATGINAMLPVARNHHLKPTLLDYRNSGDTAGDRDRVVGYASIAFSAERQP